MVVSQALYLALFGALGPTLRRTGGPLRSALATAALWTAIEWFRGSWPLGGFTWGGLGYTQHANGMLLPLASITGVWGVAFVVVAVNSLALDAWRSARATGGARRALAVGLLIPAALIVMAPALVPLPAATGPRLHVAVVQGNVPRSLASDRYLQSSAVATNEIRLTKRLAATGRRPDLVVWPEDSLSVDPAVDTALGSRVSASIRDVGAPAIVGAIGEGAGPRYYNQALLYSPDGRILARYSKIHLVPFGEYIPYPRIFGWAQRFRGDLVNLSPGHRIVLFHVDGTRVAAPICFENAFPNLFRRFVAAGASVVVVTTNDSSFLLTAMSREHVMMSQLRAVETGRYIVQAAISGESAVIDPRGRVTARTALFRPALMRAVVRESNARTLYVRFGDWFPAACAALALGWLGYEAVRRMRRRGRGGGTPERTGNAPPAGEEGGAHGRRRPAEPSRPAPISGGASRVMVVLPTYNERPTIAAVLDGVMAAGPGVDALVVDDSSPDGTGLAVREAAAANPRVRLLNRPRKLGLASAYVDGFRIALSQEYDLIVEMDADLSHRPQDLPALVSAAADHDLVVGSRYVPGGGVSNWSRGRVMLSRAANLYARTMLRLPIRDATSGFRVYRSELLEKLLDPPPRADGYAFQVELARRAVQLGASIKEVPITFRQRSHGTSKLSNRIVAEALWLVTLWGVQERRARRGPS